MSRPAIAALTAVALLAAACQTTSGNGDPPASGADTATAAIPDDDVIRNIQPGERPPLSSDEAGWWMSMDKLEKNTTTAGNLVRDPALNAYVQRIVCRVAGPYCGDIRVYIVNVPQFNAMMAPNGMMQIWTGLLLRVRNEAQLAAVIGHEIGHYLERHTLKRMREVRSTADALVFFQIGLGAVGIPLIGDLVALGALGAIQANGRDQEREADRLGLELMARAGYDPREASLVWEHIVAERDADKTAETPSLFLASHPPSDERRDTLKELAAKRTKDSSPGESGSERYWTETVRIRGGYLHDEVHLQKFDRAEWLVSSLISEGKGLGDLYFYKGEIRRLRADAEKSDMEKAIEAYRTAIATGDPPPRVYRSLGLVYGKQNRPELARDAYREYLKAMPEAEDRLFIESMIAPTS